MGLKVVGIVASPRKGMNTDTLVTKVLEGAQSIGAETKKIYLNDLEMKPCQACDKSPSPDFCFYKDGMEVIYKVLETVDAVVIGTPAYYHTISAQLKLVIDRSNCLTEMVVSQEGKTVFKSRLKKPKKGIFIWVADFSKNPEHALTMVNLWCKNVNLKLIETLIVTRSDRGEVARKRKELLQKAFALGVLLVQSPDLLHSEAGCLTYSYKNRGVRRKTRRERTSAIDDIKPRRAFPQLPRLDKNPVNPVKKKLDIFEKWCYNKVQINHKPKS